MIKRMVLSTCVWQAVLWNVGVQASTVHNIAKGLSPVAKGQSISILESV